MARVLATAARATGGASLQPRPPDAERRVLVLDAAYRPVAVISWQRAVALLLDSGSGAPRVESIVDRDVVISSPSVQILCPSVIRVMDHLDGAARRRASVRGRRGTATVARKSAIHERDRWTCAYCGWKAQSSAERARMTIDHVVPRSRGGSATEHLNLVSACRPCNGRKADRTPEEARMRLLFPPREPSWVEERRWRLTAGRALPPEWEPFLLAG
jgi:5-methylcytosine-specific restriction endonuclease McrA